MVKCACKGSFLDKFIQPNILLILYKENLHGFSIYKKLIDSKVMDYTSIDPTGLYRTLKKMENVGLLTSKIEIEDTTQPKKVFYITKEGIECLKHWENTLSYYINDIENLKKEIKKSLGE